MNPPTASAVDLKSQLHDHLSVELQQVNDQLAQQLRTQSHFVSEVVEHVSRFRGKQVRPVLTLLFERLVNKQNSVAANQLAAAVELIHAATLVHDDVIDEAETRRHVATVHRRWNTETSVLLGDYLFSKAFHLAARTGDARACELIGRATDRTCEGELNQIAARLDQSTSEIDYFRIVRDKTGQLFGLSCLLGCRAARGSSVQCRAARRFGMRLGMAFQIADDVLDLTKTTSAIGKDAGNDLQNGRLTLPVLRALKELPQTRRSDFVSALFAMEEGRPLTGRLPELQQGIASARDTAMALVDRAKCDLQHFPHSENRRLLAAVADFAVGRQH